MAKILENQYTLTLSCIAKNDDKDTLKVGFSDDQLAALEEAITAILDDSSVVVEIE